MFRAFSLAIAVLATAANIARAEVYPDRPVRLIIGFAAGSGPDIHLRTIAQELGKMLGQSFVVENRIGANGTLAARAVAQSKPDGYSLLFTSASFAVAPHIYRSLGYDTVNDFRPIANAGELDGTFLLVDAKSPIKTVQELIAKAKSDRVLYGSPGVGNGSHLTTELFAQKAGIKLQHVPYRGAAEVMTGMLSGSIDMMFITPPSVQGLLSEGRIRALAFTGSKPFPAFPNVPLMKDMLPGYESLGSWNMFLAPANTPEPIIEKLSESIRRALQMPDVVAVVQRDGFMPDNRNPAETAAFLKMQIERTGEAVKAAGIEPN